MILVWFGGLVLLFHLMKGGFFLIKGVFNLIAPFFSERERIKKTPEYKAFCKNIDLNISNTPSKKQRS